jgi:hypothetical protein
VTVAALILSYNTTASYAQKSYVYSLGGHSCGKFLAAVHGHAPGIGNVVSHRYDGHFSDGHSRYMAWLEGFFSATNLWVMNEPNGIQIDSGAIAVWIRKWCEQNPTKPLFHAAWEFAWDQRKDYLKSWLAKQAR